MMRIKFGSRSPIVTLYLLFIFTIPLMVSAQDSEPCVDKAFADFDFWVGQWDVFVKDGKQVGSNHITRSPQGCSLLEQWTNTQGTKGTSINFYNPRDGKWHQHWVGDSGEIITLSGNLIDGSMVLVGDIYYSGTKQYFDFRGKWTPLADGRVRQFFEQADETGKTWSSWFEGFYVKKK